MELCSRFLGVLDWFRSFLLRLGFWWNLVRKLEYGIVNVRASASKEVFAVLCRWWSAKFAVYA
jgi:hypothetical protein